MIFLGVNPTPYGFISPPGILFYTIVQRFLQQKIQLGPEMRNFLEFHFMAGDAVS